MQNYQELIKKLNILLKETQFIVSQRDQFYKKCPKRFKNKNEGEFYINTEKQIYEPFAKEIKAPNIFKKGHKIVCNPLYCQYIISDNQTIYCT